MAESMVPDRLISLVQDVGYRAKKGKTSVETSMSGFSILIFYYADSLQFFYGVGASGEDFTADDANSFNEDNRFCRCYVMDTGVNFEMDAFFDVDAASAKKDLTRLFDTFEVCIASAVRALLDTAARAKDVPATVDLAKPGAR